MSTRTRVRIQPVGDIAITVGGLDFTRVLTACIQDTWIIDNNDVLRRFAPKASPSRIIGATARARRRRHRISVHETALGAGRRPTSALTRLAPECGQRPHIALRVRNRLPLVANPIRANWRTLVSAGREGNSVQENRTHRRQCPDVCRRTSNSPISRHGQ
jgi:hypothetical protein